jgi:hypothetical protein
LVASRHRAHRGATRCCPTAFAACCLVACVREPTEEICPAVGPGDLVLTEIRGNQGSPDTLGQWFEILNTTSASFDLRGLQIRMYRLDGSSPIEAILRDAHIPIEAQQYFVIGHHDPNRMPDFVDATIFADHFSKSSEGFLQPRNLHPDAVIELHACGEEIDRVFYRDLPSLGTWALDGALKPTSEVNDDPDNWCNDANEPDDDGPQTALGIPGTPGEANPPCP